jgi:hypothetical protein
MQTVLQPDLSRERRNLWKPTRQVTKSQRVCLRRNLPATTIHGKQSLAPSK